MVFSRPRCGDAHLLLLYINCTLTSLARFPNHLIAKSPPISVDWPERQRRTFAPHARLPHNNLASPPNYRYPTSPPMDLGQPPPYDTVDFKALAKTDDAFKQIWQRSSGKLDFQDPETVQALSKAILKADFGLQLDVPSDRLCPPIPNRWNYVAWMQGLIDSTSPDYSIKYDANRRVQGLDIGTGASAIYAMLCLRSRPNWSMCATDIDKKSFDSAARNLALNNLMTRTKLLQTTQISPLLPLAALGVNHLDFTICNPPFFANPSDMQASLKGEGKSWRPNAICTGSENEMVYPGGDLGFVTAMVNESLTLRDKVQWYSSMFGKMDSAKAIIKLLKQHGITNWAIGVIEAGSSTKRWIVAWSFGDLRPRNVCTC